MSKKLVQINVVCNGSTGRIMNQIQEEAEKQGWEAYSFFGRGKPKNKNCIKIDSKIEVFWHVAIARLFNMQGHGSMFATYRLLKKIKRINPDIIHLHNIHGYYINYKMLLKFLAKEKIPVVWTLHDCWAFTGHCAYYVANNCNKWQKECNNCKYKKDYPKAIFCANKAKKEYWEKRKLIDNIKNITFTVPSNWLKQEAKKSFLKDKNIQVIHNFIDTSIFKPTIDDNKIRQKYNIPENKKIILGVAANWTNQKGLSDFIKLANIIENDKEIIVMVGLTDKQIKTLPKNIVGIKRTESIEELVKLYSISDVLFNPSIQETFSMVTLEALACGVPCIVMNSTATPELIKDSRCGIIEEDFEINRIYRNIKKLIEDKNKETRIEFAKKYEITKIIKQYLDIYNENNE